VNLPKVVLTDFIGALPTEKVRALDPALRASLVGCQSLLGEQPGEPER
jgi:hypothetical protein